MADPKRKNKFFGVICVFLFCAWGYACAPAGEVNRDMKDEKNQTAIATLAGGCFWCVAADMKKMPGVVKVISGYAGGRGAHPTYSSYEEKGHREAVQVFYDPRKLAYRQVLDNFLRHIDPTDPGGQFADRGAGYLSAVFYVTDEEKKTAELALRDLGASGKFDRPIVTEVIPFAGFYPAESYHQDYEQKNPAHYRAYRTGSGRERFIREVWPMEKEQPVPSPSFSPKPDDAVLKKTLTPMQYEVTQQCGTEPPFTNEYVSNTREGIYVDIVSGEPLFSSLDKYDSGSGWPSFTRPLEPGNILKKTDNTYGMVRTEIRSKQGDSHLGHVFPDGPAPAGMRYCMNSASLRFIAKEDLVREGYGRYLQLFPPAD